MGAMKRIAIYNFSDSDGIVDEFIPNMLAKLRPFVHRIVFVALYKLSDSGLASVEKLVDDVVRCERGGFVVNGYAAGLEAVGWEEIRRQDEVLFLDNSFFGPLLSLRRALRRDGQAGQRFLGPRRAQWRQ